MSWLRIDDAFSSHPKVLALGTDQRRWTWLKVLTYTCRYRSPVVPDNIAEEVPRATKPFVARCVELGLIDPQTDGSLHVHDWHEYQAGDPKKALRQAKWRKRVDAPVDGDVDAEVDEPVDASRAGARARTRPVPSTNNETQQQLRDEPAAAATLHMLLDQLTVEGGLRLAAFTDTERAIACAQKAITASTSNPAGYFRSLLESGEWPSSTPPTPPPSVPLDPAEELRRRIANGSLWQSEDLEAELIAAGINGEVATELRSALNGIPIDLLADTYDPDLEPADLDQRPHPEDT